MRRKEREKESVRAESGLGKLNLGRGYKEVRSEKERKKGKVLQIPEAEMGKKGEEEDARADRPTATAVFLSFFLPLRLRPLLCS